MGRLPRMPRTVLHLAKSWLELGVVTLFSSRLTRAGSPVAPIVWYISFTCDQYVVMNATSLTGVMSASPGCAIWKSVNIGTAPSPLALAEKYVTNAPSGLFQKGHAPDPTPT